MKNASKPLQINTYQDGTSFTPYQPKKPVKLIEFNPATFKYIKRFLIEPVFGENFDTRYNPDVRHNITNVIEELARHSAEVVGSEGSQSFKADIKIIDTMWAKIYKSFHYWFRKLDYPQGYSIRAMEENLSICDEDMRKFLYSFKLDMMIEISKQLCLMDSSFASKFQTYFEKVFTGCALILVYMCSGGMPPQYARCGLQGILKGFSNILRNLQLEISDSYKDVFATGFTCVWSIQSSYEAVNTVLNVTVGSYLNRNGDDMDKLVLDAENGNVGLIPSSNVPLQSIPPNITSDIDDKFLKESIDKWKMECDVGTVNHLIYTVYPECFGMDLDRKFLYPMKYSDKYIDENHYNKLCDNVLNYVLNMLWSAESICMGNVNPHGNVYDYSITSTRQVIALFKMYEQARQFYEDAVRSSEMEGDKECKERTVAAVQFIIASVNLNVKMLDKDHDNYTLTKTLYKIQMDFAHDFVGNFHKVRTFAMERIVYMRKNHSEITLQQSYKFDNFARLNFLSQSDDPDARTLFNDMIVFLEDAGKMMDSKDKFVLDIASMTNNPVYMWSMLFVKRIHDNCKINQISKSGYVKLEPIIKSYQQLIKKREEELETSSRDKQLFKEIEKIEGRSKSKSPGKSRHKTEESASNTDMNKFQVPSLQPLELFTYELKSSRISNPSKVPQFEVPTLESSTFDHSTLDDPELDTYTFDESSFTPSFDNQPIRRFDHYDTPLFGQEFDRGFGREFEQDEYEDLLAHLAPDGLTSEERQGVILNELELQRAMFEDMNLHESKFSRFSDGKWLPVDATPQPNDLSRQKRNVRFTESTFQEKPNSTRGRNGDMESHDKFMESIDQIINSSSSSAQTRTKSKDYTPEQRLKPRETLLPRNRSEITETERSTSTERKRAPIFRETPGSTSVDSARSKTPNRKPRSTTPPKHTLDSLVTEAINKGKSSSVQLPVSKTPTQLPASKIPTSEKLAESGIKVVVKSNGKKMLF